MKEYRKTETVQAKIFEPGDEDGWSGIVTSGLVTGSRVENRPYISNIDKPSQFGYFFENYLCVNADGKKWLVEKSIFESTYEEVVKNRI